MRLRSTESPQRSHKGILFILLFLDQFLTSSLGDFGCLILHIFFNITGVPNLFKQDGKQTCHVLPYLWCCRVLWVNNCTDRARWFSCCVVDCMDSLIHIRKDRQTDWGTNQPCRPMVTHSKTTYLAIPQDVLWEKDV